MWFPHLVAQISSNLTPNQQKRFQVTQISESITGSVISLPLPLPRSLTEDKVESVHEWQTLVKLMMRLLLVKSSFWRSDNWDYPRVREWLWMVRSCPAVKPTRFVKNNVIIRPETSNAIKQHGVRVSTNKAQAEVGVKIIWQNLLGQFSFSAAVVGGTIAA